MMNLISRKPLALICTVSLFLLGCAAPEPPAAEVPEEPSGPQAEYFLSKDQGHNRWSRTIPPVLTVPSGAIVEVETKEASDEQISATSTIEDFLNMDSSKVHPLTGPVYVDGAELGDILAVTLHEIEPLG